MKTNILSQYSQSPFLLIGLERKGHPVLTDLNNKNSNEIKQIFHSKTDCENFITSHAKNEKIVLIVSSDSLTDGLTKFQKYLQVDAIYSYYQSDDFNEEFICIYKKAEEGKYWKVLRGFLESIWFIIGLIIVIIFAYFLPNVGASDGPLYTRYTIKMGCVFIIFLLSSLALPLKNLLKDVLNFRLHLCTQIYSLVLIPFFVFGIALLLGEASINKILVTGMIVMGCIPTSNSINIVATKYCAGNEAGTLLNILFGSIIGIFLSPAMITMFMNISHITTVEQGFNIKDYGGVLIQLSITVLAPIVIGQIITFIWTEQMMWAKTKLHFSEISVVAVLLIIWAVMCDLFKSKILDTVDTSDLLLVILFDALLFVMFLITALYIAILPNPFTSREREIDHDHLPLLQERQTKSPTIIQRWRFTHADAISFMFCGSTKTLALGVPLISALYPNSSSGYVGLVTLPLVLYDVEQIMITSVAIMILQHYFPPPTEKFTER